MKAKTQIGEKVKRQAFEYYYRRDGWTFHWIHGYPYLIKNNPRDDASTKDLALEWKAWVVSWQAATKQENEAAAKICEIPANRCYGLGSFYADKIRARLCAKEPKGS